MIEMDGYDCHEQNIMVAITTDLCFYAVQEKTMSEMAWLQFLFTLKFWIEDTSLSFEKTDIFIEKSVNTSFDLMDIAPLKSLIDFGKFMWQEKASFKM